MQVLIATRRFVFGFLFFIVFSLIKIDVYTLRCGFGFVNVYAYAIILNLLNTERSDIGVKLIYLEGLL